MCWAPIPWTFLHSGLETTREQLLSQTGTSNLPTYEVQFPSEVPCVCLLLHTCRSGVYAPCFGLSHSHGFRQLNLLQVRTGCPGHDSIPGSFMSFPFGRISGEARGRQEWEHHKAEMLILVMLLMFPASFLSTNDSSNIPKSQGFQLCLIFPCTHANPHRLWHQLLPGHSFLSHKMSGCDLPYFTSAILPFNLITAKYQVVTILMLCSISHWIRNNETGLNLWFMVNCRN